MTLAETECQEGIRGQQVRYLQLSRLRQQIAEQAEALLANHPDSRRLMSVPGIGPTNALTIIAEAGDLRRFAHYRQFLKFCGMNLSTQQSGRFRGQSRLSKYGNARLRTVFWLAAQTAVRMREKQLAAQILELYTSRSARSGSPSQGLHRGCRQAGPHRLRTDQE